MLKNEQVTDISQVLKRQTSEKASMREGMDAKHMENVNLCRNVEKLQAENRTLRKRLEKYDGAKENSNNSTTPPSKAPMKEELRHTKSLRRKSGIKPNTIIYR